MIVYMFMGNKICGLGLKIGFLMNNDDFRNIFWLCNNEFLGLIVIYVYEFVFFN